jgi:hypothetical protein
VKQGHWAANPPFCNQFEEKTTIHFTSNTHNDQMNCDACNFKAQGTLESVKWLKSKAMAIGVLRSFDDFG